jgi:hypothetical protein
LLQPFKESCGALYFMLINRDVRLRKGTSDCHGLVEVTMADINQLFAKYPTSFGVVDSFLSCLRIERINQCTTALNFAIWYFNIVKRSFLIH